MSIQPAVNRWPFVLGLIAAIAVFIWALHPILAPFLVGALIAYLGDPVVDALEARGFGRSSGVILVFLMLILVTTVILLVGIPLLIDQLDQAIKKLPILYRWVSTSLLPSIHERISVSPVQLPPIDWEAELAARWQSVGKLLATSVASLTRSGFGVIAAIFNMTLIPVVAFYLMRDWDRMMAAILDLVPIAWQQDLSRMVSEANDVLGAFIRGQFLVMLAQAFMYSAGLWIVGLDFALILGTVAGLASIIPYAGAVLGVGSSLVVAWFQTGGDLGLIAWVGLVFAVGQTVESMILTPLLIGDRIGLHPVLVIFALLAGGQLAGFTGVLLALPVAAVIVVFCRYAVGYYRNTDTYRSD
jgi:predicted PurR-regulated permease PerM